METVALQNFAYERKRQWSLDDGPTQRCSYLVFLFVKGASLEREGKEKEAGYMIWLWDKQSAQSLLFLSFFVLQLPRLDHNSDDGSYDDDDN